MSGGLIGLLGAIAVIATVGVVAAMRDPKKPETPRLPAPAARTTPRPQPPGPVPAGKVWSAEHGHWHNARPQQAPQASPIQMSPGANVPVKPSQPMTPKPQPPGPAPAGQVWSTEHGHWHDARTP